MSRNSLTEYPRFTKKKSTISNLIDVFFRGNKGAKIGIIKENVDTTISRDGDGDDDYDDATNIRKASPISSSPISSSKKPSSKKPSSKTTKVLPITGGKSRNSRKTRKTRKKQEKIENIKKNIKTKK